MKRFRIILDTNVLLDAAYSQRQSALKVLEGCRRGLFVPVVSKDTLMEMYHVLFKFPSSSSRSVALESWEKVMNKAFILPVVKSHLKISPDPADDKFINLAVSGGAPFIVTRNMDDFYCVEDHRLKTYDGNLIKVYYPDKFIQQIQAICKNDVVKEYENLYPAIRHISYQGAQKLYEFHLGKDFVMPIEEIRDAYKRACQDKNIGIEVPHFNDLYTINEELTSAEFKQMSQDTNQAYEIEHTQHER